MLAPARKEGCSAVVHVHMVSMEQMLSAHMQLC
jgi:hypothetical protein